MAWVGYYNIMDQSQNFLGQSPNIVPESFCTVQVVYEVSAAYSVECIGMITRSCCYNRPLSRKSFPD